MEEQLHRQVVLPISAEDGISVNRIKSKLSAFICLVFVQLQSLEMAYYWAQYLALQLPLPQLTEEKAQHSNRDPMVYRK